MRVLPSARNCGQTGQGDLLQHFGWQFPRSRSAGWGAACGSGPGWRFRSRPVGCTVRTRNLHHHCSMPRSRSALP
jgi:hypothetical protein